MAPGKVTPANVYSVWQRVNSLQAKIPIGQVNFKVHDHVRISKQKVLFAKGYEQNLSYRNIPCGKIIQRRPQPVYQLADLQAVPWKGSFTITS
jgi:hypothetical protein